MALKDWVTKNYLSDQFGNFLIRCGQLFVKKENVGELQYYFGMINSGEIGVDLKKFNITPDMTLLELFNNLPKNSVWEIYFNSQNNTINNDMPVTTGGILKIVKISVRGEISFFNYRNNDEYFNSYLDGNLIGWKINKGIEILNEEQTEANTTPDKYVSDAMVTKELILRQNGVQWILNEETGEITGYKTKAGADTVFPFSGDGGFNDYKYIMSAPLSYSYSGEIGDILILMQHSSSQFDNTVVVNNLVGGNVIKTQKINTSYPLNMEVIKCTKTQVSFTITGSNLGFTAQDIVILHK